MKTVRVSSFCLPTLFSPCYSWMSNFSLFKHIYFGNFYFIGSLFHFVCDWAFLKPGKAFFAWQPCFPNCCSRLSTNVRCVLMWEKGEGGNWLPQIAIFILAKRLILYVICNLDFNQCKDFKAELYGFYLFLDHPINCLN